MDESAGGAKDWGRAMRKMLVLLGAIGALGALVRYTGGQVLYAQASYVYAIQGARIVPVSGSVMDGGTIVVRDGLISAVGTNVTIPAGAQIIAGKGLTVYPGLIDLGSTSGLDMPAVPRAEN